MADEPQEAAEGEGSWAVTIYVEARTPEALWEAACSSFIDENPGSAIDPDMFGTREEPDVANCLRQMADPGVSWPGTKILDSSAEQG